MPLIRVELFDYRMTEETSAALIEKLTDALCDATHPGLRVLKLKAQVLAAIESERPAEAARLVQELRVVAPDVGGSFGIKIHVYQDDMAACALALTLGRPVKFVATRRESFVSDIHAREQVVDVEYGVDADGRLVGIRAGITAAVGPYSAFPRSSVVEGGQVLRLLPGPYQIRDYDATLRVVAQNKVVTSQYRAVGHPIAAAVTEWRSQQGR